MVRGDEAVFRKLVLYGEISVAIVISDSGPKCY